MGCPGGNRAGGQRAEGEAECRGQVTVVMKLGTKVGVRVTIGGTRAQALGQVATHLEVIHFYSKAKNTGSTPHGLLKLTVLRGIWPRL